MRNPRKLKQHAMLAIVMTFVVYVVSQAVTLAHEAAHGLTAVMVGGYFPFVQLDADGGRSVYVLPAGAPAWKEAFVLLGGPAANFLIALIALAAVAVGFKKRGLRLFVIFTGGLSALMLVTGTGLLPPWWFKYKETGEALVLLNTPLVFQFAIKTVWLLSGIALTVGFFRLFFKELTSFFAASSYKERLLLVSSALAIPCACIMAALSIVMLSSGYGEGVITTRRHLPHIIFLIAAYFLLPVAVRAGTPSETGREFKVPRRQFITAFTLAASLAFSQPVVFGNDRLNPSGLFLSRPPEVAVSACNIRITVSETNTARVQFLMRPYIREHNFLWDRVKNEAPVDWRPYEEFVKKSVPAFLGTDQFRIINHSADSRAQFFNGSWSEGARVIEAEVNLADLPEPEQKIGRVIKVTDFWRTSNLGYIDYTEIILEGNRRFTGVRATPSTSPPSFQTDQVVRWENHDFNSSYAIGAVAFK